MPRTADHELRRRQLAAAVHRLVAGTGLDAATVAAVAREAGFSVGLVQHYFPSKDALLLFAYRSMTTDQRQRVAARIAAGEAREQPIAELVYGCLPELLPLDAARRSEYRLGRAFLGRSLDNPELAAEARATSRDIRAQLAAAVRNGKECGEVEQDADAELFASRVTALVGGLAEQLYQEPTRSVGRRRLPAAARHLLRSCVDDVFTGTCHHYR